MSSFKRLYLFGFIILLFGLVLVTCVGYQISRKLDWVHPKNKEQNKIIVNETDTIIKEVIVEKKVKDTIYLKYTPPKPKLEVKDTSTNRPSPSLTQSQD